MTILFGFLLLFIIPFRFWLPIMMALIGITLLVCIIIWILMIGDIVSGGTSFVSSASFWSQAFW